RTLYEASVKQEGDRIEFRFWGNGFLYHMARNLVGTLVNVGRGKITPYEFREILEARDRHRAGATAPAQGLYLLQVNY
ncbi:MAG: tRNA pseudouridine(38-40) synthase TruA, partial [Selenomonadaceae bacterium]